jgi:hypothetical protein
MANMDVWMATGTLVLGAAAATIWPPRTLWPTGGVQRFVMPHGSNEWRIDPVVVATLLFGIAAAAILVTTI